MMSFVLLCELVCSPVKRYQVSGATLHIRSDCLCFIHSACSVLCNTA